MSWADAAAAVVAEVIRSLGRSDMKVLRRALTDAYPWGERENAPYKALASSSTSPSNPPTLQGKQPCFFRFWRSLSLSHWLYRPW
jgi:hypothetical protein